MGGLTRCGFSGKNEGCDSAFVLNPATRVVSSTVHIRSHSPPDQKDGAQSCGELRKIAAILLAAPAGSGILRPCAPRHNILRNTTFSDRILLGIVRRAH